LVLLNHFTVPEAMTISFQSWSLPEKYFLANSTIERKSSWLRAL